MDRYLEGLLDLIKSKKNDDPSVSYTAQLHAKGINEILKKIAEESSETIIAAKENNNNELVHEIADLWFHCLVLLSEKNLKVEDIIKELKSREGISGIEEKNNRNPK
ncbi:MAG: phosphoribosyl-ATP diphosphatase [Methylophilaceae bacterium]|jgi:phosphoribosyl-ATP pyrophosphohydrolase|nr:phosphoribosyl-ATP diphosphatase [Methylophilaceae bacterium]